MKKAGVGLIKRITFLLFLIIFILFISSCTKDKYITGEPFSTFFGIQSKNRFIQDSYEMHSYYKLDTFSFWYPNDFEIIEDKFIIHSKYDDNTSRGYFSITRPRMSRNEIIHPDGNTLYKEITDQWVNAFGDICKIEDYTFVNKSHGFASYSCHYYVTSPNDPIECLEIITADRNYSVYKVVYRCYVNDTTSSLNEVFGTSASTIKTNWALKS